MSLTATTNTTDSLEVLEEYDDLAAWINDTLTLSTNDGEDNQNTLENLSQLDQQITRLIASLDIACEDTSSQLERIIDDVSRGVPRLTYDLHFIKDGAVSLQTALGAVHERSRAAIPDSMNASLEQLKRLDLMKGHMEAAREVLREAESWSTLELEVTSFLTEQNYAKAASRLSEANKSMVVFQNTPEYDPRRTLLVNLQNQLEASLSSALVAAINEQELDTCRNYFSIFSNIQREQEFRNYYNGSRRASLVSMWEQAQVVEALSKSSDSTSTVEVQTFSEFLSKFYTSMLTLLNQERTSIPAIFPDPAISLSSLISSTFSALQPTFSQRLDSLVTHYGDAALSELIKVFCLTEEFASGVDKVMQKIRFSAAPSSSSTTTDGAVNTEPPPSPATPSHSRRRSMRMSMSFRSNSARSGSSSTGIPKISSLTMDGLDWDQELFQPLLEYQVDYGTLERKLLDDQLRTIISNGSSGNNDQARLIRERAIDIFSMAEESLMRCTTFTHGYASVGLVHALDGFLKSFVDMWTADLRFSSSSHSSSSFAASSAMQDFSGLDYSPEDWTRFQSTLDLLGSAKNIFERMVSFEEVKLKSYLVQTAMKFKLYAGDPVNFPIVGASKGEGQLLEQSTLNSVELHGLLEKVDGSSEVGGHHHYHQQQHPLSNKPGVGGGVLLTEARSAVFDFARACQVSLETTISTPLQRSLESYASSPWMAEAKNNAKTNVTNELVVPTFSLSPSEVIMRVTEGLINLPQVFEVHGDGGDDDVLSFSLYTLPNVDPEILKSLPHYSSPSALDAKKTKMVTIDAETVSSAWLSSIGRSLLMYLTGQVLPKIPRLTKGGTAQLAVDLGYLLNVARSLNLEHEELERWKEVVDMDEESGRVGGENDYVFEQVARMRGWR